MKINDLIPTPPGDDWLERQSLSPASRDAGFGRRDKGTSRKALYKGLLRELTSLEDSAMEELANAEEDRVQRGLSHPDRVVRTRAAGAVADRTQEARRMATRKPGFDLRGMLQRRGSDLSKKAVSARRFMGGLLRGSATPDFTDFVSPVQVESMQRTMDEIFPGPTGRRGGGRGGA